MEQLKRIKIAKFSTPWGVAHIIHQFGDLKVYKVNTEIHGGVMIHVSEAQHFTPNCISRAWKVGEWLCYEEDCCAQMPLYEWYCQNPTSCSRLELDLLHRILSYNWADYLIERDIEPEPAEYRKYLEHQAHNDAVRRKDPNCIQNFELSPETRVQTADGQWYSVPFEVLEKARQMVWWGLFVTHLRAVGGEHLCR